MPFAKAFAIAAGEPREYPLLRFKIDGVDMEPLRYPTVDDVRGGEWRVHRPGEMDPIEAAALRAAALRDVMR